MVNTIFNWAIVAIVSSFTMMPASINRQSAPISEPVVEEAELKGCATNFDDYRIPFYYDGPNYTKTEVEKRTNWKHGSNPAEDCNEVDVLACGLLVNPDFVDDSNPSIIKLDQSINLTAKQQPDPNSPTYVESITLNSGVIINKSM